MTLEMLQDQISKTFHTTNDLTTTNNIISSARNTGWDPSNLSNSQISVIQRNLQERESSGAHKRSSPDDPIYEPEALFGGKTQAVEAVELDLSQKQFGDHPNQETNTTGEAFGSGGKQTKPVAFGQQYLDQMFPGQGQFRLNSVEQGTKTLAGLRSYLSDLLDQSRKNQLLTKQYTTKTALGNELHGRAGIASVHAQQAELSNLVKGTPKLRREINAVLGKSFVSKMLLNTDLRQAYMQSKRDNTFETASIYLKKYIDHNLQGDDQTSANLVVNETAAAFCTVR